MQHLTPYALFEGKQVGILYHFVGEYLNEYDGDHELLYTLDLLLDSNELKPGNYSYISFTRNKNLGFDSRKVRLVIDGDLLSNRYQIEAFHDREQVVGDEYEERYMTTIKRPSITHLKKYIIRVEIDADYKGSTKEEVNRLSIKHNIPFVFVENYQRVSKLTNVHPRTLPGYDITQSDN